MATFDAVDHYFSGQGVVMLGIKDPVTGKPKGLTPIGNVSALQITIETTNLEHKESHTGQRGTDLRLTTEIQVGLNMTVENFVSENLARALRGTSTRKAAGNVASEPVKLYAGMVTGFDNIRIDSLVLTQGGEALTHYVDDTTPYDYIANLDAGSVKMNDGAILPLDKFGVTVTGITVGATTLITVANTAEVGDVIVVRGATGADAADINGKAATITARSPTTVTVGLNLTGKTITTAAGTKATFDSGIDATAAYGYSVQFLVDAMNSGAKEMYMRFEGLNTAKDNAPVVVEVFKFNTDPLQQLDLISDGVQQFQLEGSCLADNTQLVGSKYFKITKLE